MGLPMSHAAVKDHLKAVRLFANRHKELEVLASASRAVSYRKGARIFEEGSVADCCYVLTSGRAKVVLDSEDGDEVLLRDVRPSDLIGELALVDGFRRSAAFVTVEASHFIVIPAPAFDALRANTAFERMLVAQIASALRERSEHVRQVTTGPSIARVAWCLGEIAHREGRRDGRSIVIPNKPQQELAGMAGCSRETVNRALHKLKQKKCVTWSNGTMRLEIDGLQRYVRKEIGGAGRPRA